MSTTGKVAHTPGPWEWHAQGDANEYVLLTNEKRWVIAFRQNGELLLPEQEANARLIEAAPVMLEALRVLVDHAQEKYPHFESERGQQEIATALAIIAKVEGK
jgi:hypothetical protein